MADNQQGALMLAQHAFHPFDCGQIHMVCRFVKKQNIRLGIKRTCQRYAPRFTAGQSVGHTVAIQPHTHQNRFGLMRLFVASIGFHSLGHQRNQAHPRRNIRGLRQIGNFGTGRCPQTAFVHFATTRHQLHQAGFARTITPDQRQPVSRM